MDILIVFSTLLNIGAILAFVQLYRKYKMNKTQETIAIYNSMKEFIGNMEKENDDLYTNLTDYIKVKERELTKRISLLEKRAPVPLESSILSPSAVPIKNENEFTELAAAERHDEKVLTLHKQGFSSKQIAKVLKIDHGEIELIINMLQKKKSYQQ